MKSIWLLLPVFLLTASCGEKVSVTKNQAAVKPVSVPKPKETTQPAPEEPTGTASSRKNWLVVVESEDKTGAPVAEMPIWQNQTAVAQLFDLEAGKQYEARWTLQDAKGNAILSTNFSFVPTDTGYRLWWPFQGDFRVHKPGRWTWKCAVKGLPTLQTHITMLPPTPAELDSLARHEKAREVTFRAFANYWASDGEQDDYVTRLESFNEDKEPAYLRVKNLTYNFTNDGTSEADALNGITYRGSATFRFSVYQFFDTRVGWSEWKDNSWNSDLNRALNQFLQRWGVTEVPWEAEGKLNLKYTIMERDKNWFVTTATGERFANGKRAPQVGEITRYYMTALRAAEARALVKDGRRPDRESDQLLGKAAKEDPELIERGIIETMTQLRGYPLAQ